MEGANVRCAHVLRCRFKKKAEPMAIYTRVKCCNKEASISRIQNKTLTDAGFKIVDLNNQYVTWYREAHHRAIRLQFGCYADVTPSRLVESLTKFFVEPSRGPIV